MQIPINATPRKNIAGSQVVRVCGSIFLSSLEKPHGTKSPRATADAQKKFLLQNICLLIRLSMSRARKWNHENVEITATWKDLQ